MLLSPQGREKKNPTKKYLDRKKKTQPKNILTEKQAKEKRYFWDL